MTKFAFTFRDELDEDIATKISAYEEGALDAFDELSEEQKNTFRQAVIWTAKYFFEADADEIERLKKDTIYEIFFYEGMFCDRTKNENEKIDYGFNPLLIMEKIEEEEDCNAESADFYAVQGWVDGFGNDTATWAIFKTREEAIEYTKDWKCEYKIVPQWWGEYENYYD